MSKIAFIGLGHMGSPIAENLVKAGHQLAVFDVNAEAMSRLESQGATACQSVAQAVNDAQFVFTMVQTGEQVQQICLGEQGVFAHLHPEAVYIDCSSIDVDTCQALHQQAQTQNIQMLDAPVSGGVAGAQAASLTVMVGGAESAFQQAQPILASMGKKIIHAGEAGRGQAAKICNNMILGISMIAVSEAFALAEKLGLAADKLFEISSNASGQCWAMTSYCPYPGLVDNVPSNNNYQPGFTSTMMLKDLRLSQDAARSVHAKTPMGAEATAVYAQYVAQGHGDIDFSGIIQLLNEG